MSKLRFHLVHHHPHLLRKRDINGVLPLHVACKNNDVEFISWLFQNIIAAEDRGTQELPVMSDVKRTRSQSDLIAPLTFLPSNQSVRDFSAEFSSIKQSLLRSTTHSTDNRKFVDREGDEVDGSPAQPLNSIGPLMLLHPREQALAGLSYDSLRSSTISVSDSSRSGSSEPHYPFPTVKYTRHRAIKSSGSSDEPDGGDHARASVMSGEVKIFLPRHFSSDDDSGDDLVGENGTGSTVEPEISMLLDPETLTSAHTLTIADITDTKPFSIDVNGDSIFHILAREGNAEALGIIVKVAAFLRHQIDLSILTVREGFSSRLPIEEALYVKNFDCVQLLIHLCTVSGLMPALLQDPHILRVAVVTGDMRMVHVLIASGFHKGLKPAITLALISDFHEILRLLLFWHTQIVNSLEYSRVVAVHGRRVRRLDRGVIEWEEIQLENICEEWLKDSQVAVTSVSSTLSYAVSTDLTRHNSDYFKRLGRDCLQHFGRPDGLMMISLIPITELNISENQLFAVPKEIFQLPSLRILRLSQNKLQNLPSSDNPFEKVYTSNLVKLQMDGNQLTELPEDLFCGTADSLRELSVQYNNLQSLPPGLWMMPKLRKIQLAHNKLERLHCFSFPSYFNDVELSRRVTSSFTVNKDGHLICTSDKRDSREMQQCESYLRRLALFYHMICSSRCSEGQCPYSPRLIFQEMINIHLARLTNFTRSSDTMVSVPNSAQILSLFEEEEEFGTLTECTMQIDLLDLSDNNFKEFPWDLACISPNLKKLDIRDNAIQQFDIVHSVPRNLTSLIAVRNKISALKKERSINLPCGNPLRLLCVQDDMEVDCYCQHCRHSALGKMSNLILDHNKLSYLPIVDEPKLESPAPSSELNGYEVIHCDTYYRELSILSLAHNELTTIPRNLHRLRHLSSLTLSHNKITELPLEMGLMNSGNLLLLKLDGMFIRNIPDNLLEQQLPRKMLNYLKSLQQK
jgi:Leucine-rich repeat (LRR) protein